MVNSTTNVNPFQDLMNFLGGLFNPQSAQANQMPSVIGNPQDMKLTITHPSASPLSVNTDDVVNSFQGTPFNDHVASALGRNPDLSQKPMSDQVKQAITGASQEFKTNPQLMFDIGYSEGGFRPDAANTTPEGQKVGVPRGLFQFTPNTWNKDLVNYAKMPNSSLQNWLVNGNAPDINDPAANSRAASYLISHGQLGRWDASKPNWGRFYSPEEIKSYYSQTPGEGQ